jgi:hypothetical protein
MWRSMMRRVGARTESHGGHFEHYKFTLSAVTNKLNASGRVLMWTLFVVLVLGTCAQFVRTFQSKRI